MGAREEGGGVGSEWEIGGLEAGVRSGCRLNVVADGCGGVLATARIKGVSWGYPHIAAPPPLSLLTSTYYGALIGPLINYS